MSQLTNKRDKPQSGDLTGNFDLWSDCGARFITGETEFSFTPYKGHRVRHAIASDDYSIPGRL
jgi:hypothetical protein